MDNSLSQPYEVKSFEGGITDFFLQAPNTFCERADNFVVNNDLKLEVRWGSFLWDALRNNHMLDQANPRRIDNFMLFRDESILLAKSGRDVYYPNFVSGVWTKLSGPTGNEVYSEGSYYSFSTQANWNGHLFTTSSAASLPSKIFQDETGAMQVRSVGLPPVKNPVNENDTTTLTACINLANDLRTSMLAHFADASYDNGGVSANFSTVNPPNTGTALHFVKDKSASTYLASQSGTISPAAPSPLPSPASAATDQASLYTLVVALCKASIAHIQDANTTTSYGTVGTGYVHLVSHSLTGNSGTNASSPSGPNISVSDSTVPDSLENARVRLNEIRKFWEWHRLAVSTHAWYSVYNTTFASFFYSGITSYGTLNRYGLTYPEVPSPGADGNPEVAANYGKFIGYVNSLKYFYNGHVTNGYYVSGSASPPPSPYVTYFSNFEIHARSPGNSLYENSAITPLDAIKCELPDAASFNDACLTLFWLRALWAKHYNDAALTAPSTGFTFSATNGSANITSVADLSGTAITLPVGALLGSSVYPYVNVPPTSLVGPVGDSGGTYVTASASGTATLSRVWNGPTLSNRTGMYGYSRFHYAGAGGGVTPSGSASAVVSSDETLANYAAIGASAQEWVTLATEFSTALSTHANSTVLHRNSTQLYQFSQYYSGAATLDSLDPSVGDFIYAFVFKNTYKTVDGVEFIEYSNPVQVGASGYPINYPLGHTASSDTTAFTFPGAVSNSVVAQYGTVITGIPAVANTSKTNYELSKIEVQIYRTINTGTTFYLLATLPNGTTTYTDVTNDTLSNAGEKPLNTRETLYTTGGVVGFDPPPRARFIHILQNTAIYGAIYDGEEYFPNRLLQSIPGTPAATNLTFYDDLEEAVTGLASSGGNFIAFSLTKTYRLAGGYNELGQGNLSHERISDNVGCISESSIVQTDTGVFYAGNDGFYFTDGYSVKKISAQIDKTYQKYTQTQNQRDRIQGTYDRQFRRVYWTMQANPTGADCGQLFVLHTGYSNESSNGVFTSWNNGVNFMPSSVTYFKNQLVRGDYRGVVYYHSSYSKTDPAIPSDLTIEATAWNTVHLPYKYKSPALDFNTTFKGQWATRLHVSGRNVGNAAIQVSTVREIDNESARDFSPIFYKQNIIWGDANVTWGDPDVIWEYDKTLDEWRRFPTKSLRSQFRQVEIKPGYVVTNKYDDYPDQSFASTISQAAFVASVAILTPAGFTSITWPLNIVGQTIAFDIDDYTTEYTITAITNSNTRLTLADPTNGLASLPTSMKWQISGYLKEQRFQLSSYDIHFGFMGQRGKAAVRGEGGGNG